MDTAAEELDGLARIFRVAPFRGPFFYRKRPAGIRQHTSAYVSVCLSRAVMKRPVGGLV